MNIKIEEYKIKKITLWLLYLEKITDEELEKMYALCSGQRQEKADRIKQGMKRKQSIAAGYLLFLLKERFSIEEEPVILSGGKPVFPEHGQGEGTVHFSISHSRDAVLLAFGERPLGADIEFTDRADLKVAKRFFTKEEYERLADLEGGEQKDAFCRIWTGKEAVVKAAGSGLATALNGFSVLGETAELSGERYELYRQKIAAGGQSAWICAAQLIEDPTETDYPM